MYGVVPSSRKSNHYCPPPHRDEATVFDTVSSYPALCGKLHHWNRYRGLNYQNLANPDRMTVEWRIHGGTTDWEKIDFPPRQTRVGLGTTDDEAASRVDADEGNEPIGSGFYP